MTDFVFKIQGRDLKGHHRQRYLELMYRDWSAVRKNPRPGRFRAWFERQHKCKVDHGYYSNPWFWQQLAFETQEDMMLFVMLHAKMDACGAW